MMYCQQKGTYYVQLEDDIISKPSYLMKMESFATNSALVNQDWLILDFCSLGFIGNHKKVKYSLFSNCLFSHRKNVQNSRFA